MSYGRAASRAEYLAREGAMAREPRPQPLTAEEEHQSRAGHDANCFVCREAHLHCVEARLYATLDAERARAETAEAQVKHLGGACDYSGKVKAVWELRDQAERERDMWKARAERAEKTMQGFLDTPPAQMTTSIGLQPVNSEGMRTMVDALVKTQAENATLAAQVAELRAASRKCASYPTRGAGIRLADRAGVHCATACALCAGSRVMAREPSPLTAEEEASLRSCRRLNLASSLSRRLLATLDAARARAALAERERNHLQQRQEHVARLLHVPDGGQYRNDWDAAIERLQAENATLAAQVEAMATVVQAADETLAHCETVRAGHDVRVCFSALRNALTAYHALVDPKKGDTL